MAKAKKWIINHFAKAEVIVLVYVEEIGNNDVTFDQVNIFIFVGFFASQGLLLWIHIFDALI